MKLSVVHVCHCLVTGDILVSYGILLLKQVALLAQLVHVVPECVVLLLRLNEGCYNLVNVRDARALLNNFEGLFNHLRVPGVLCQQSGLFLVFVANILQPNFKNFDWVVKLLVCTVSFALLTIEVVLFDRLCVVTVLKTFLELFDLNLELLFPILRLSLEGKNPVVMLSGGLGEADALPVGSGSGGLKIVDLLLHGIDRVLGEDDLLAHDIYLNLQVVVFANRVVQPHFLILKLVVERLSLYVFLVLLGLIRDLLLDLGIDLVQSLHLLVVLVVDDGVALTFVLKSAGVIVSLTLESLNFSFIKATWGSLGLVLRHLLTLCQVN